MTVLFKNLIVPFALFAGSMGFAQTTMTEQAEIVARKQLNLSVDSRLQLDASKDSYFVFNAEGGGWAVVSKHSPQGHVLAFSDKGRFVSEDIPWIIESWLTRCCKNTEESIDDRMEIEPLVLTEWGQHEPYNLLVQQAGNSNGSNILLTGCGITAAAQVMKYHKWPAEVTHSIGQYPDSLPETAFDWDGMQNTYLPNDSSSSAFEVAKLMKYLGKGFEATYFKNGTSAFPEVIMKGLVEHFGYSHSINLLGVPYFPARNWNFQYLFKEMDKAIYHNLSEGIPVMIENDVERRGQHLFVADGYKRGGYFHFNWGWDGRYNGYYKFPIDTIPFEDRPTKEMCFAAIVDIKPSAENERKRLLFVDLYSDIQECFRPSSNDDFLIPDVELWYIKNNYHLFDIGIGLYKGDELLDVFDAGNSEIENFPLFSDYREIDLKFGSLIDDGSYRLVCMSKIHNTTEWVPASGGYRDLIVIIEGNHLRCFSQESYDAYLSSVKDTVLPKYQNNNRYYNLKGQQIDIRQHKGMYIDNGKLKYLSNSSFP